MGRLFAFLFVIALAACSKGAGNASSQPFDTTITTQVQFINAPTSDLSARPHAGAKVTEPAFTINALNVDDALIAGGYAKPYYWLFKPGYKQDEDQRSLMLTAKGKSQGWKCKTTADNPNSGEHGDTLCNIPVGTIVATDVKESTPPYGNGKEYAFTCIPQPNDFGRLIVGVFPSSNWLSNDDGHNWTFGKTESCKVYVAPDGTRS